MKIYAGDTNLPYKTTAKTALDSKRDIDGILAKWGITKVLWVWDLDHNKVEVTFELNEKFQDREINPLVRLAPPLIWLKKARNKAEAIDWKLSMRIFHWWIYNQLAMSYASQSEKILDILPYVVVDDKNTVKDIIIPRLEEIKNLKALPHQAKQDREPKTIDVEWKET